MSYENDHRAEMKAAHPKGHVENAAHLIASHLGRLDQAVTNLVGVLMPILREEEPRPAGPSHDGRGGSAFAEILFNLADEVEARAEAIERLAGRVDL